MNFLVLLKDFAFDMRYVLVVIVCVAVYAVFEYTSFRGKAFEFMMLAKHLAKEAILRGGCAQETWVVNKIYPLLPIWIRLIGDEDAKKDQLRMVVHYLYEKAKDKLDDGILNGTDGTAIDPTETVVVKLESNEAKG